MAVRLEKEGSVARLVIDRPDSRNALSHAMWVAMLDHLDTIVEDAAVRVVLLTGSQPGIFCAGADIKEFAAHALDPAWRSENQRAINAVQYRLARLEQPVIAAIDGDCVGGGCGLALACDMRIASPQARFGITPAKLGIAYSLHDTKLLVDLVGPAQAKRILFTASLLSADEAARIGLVEIVADDPLIEAWQLAQTIASVSSYSVRHSKATIRCILDGQAEDDDSSLHMFFDAFTRPDFAEGVAAFLEKRRPNFG